MKKQTDISATMKDIIKEILSMHENDEIDKKSSYKVISRLTGWNAVDIKKFENGIDVVEAPLATGYKIIGEGWICCPDGTPKKYSCPGIFMEYGEPWVGGRGMHFCNTIKGCFEYSSYSIKDNIHIVKVSAYREIEKKEGRDGILYATNCLMIEKEITEDYRSAIENPSSIKDMENPDREIIMAAIKTDPTAIQFVSTPDEEMTKSAIRAFCDKEINPFDYIDSQQQELAEYIIRLWPFAIQFIKDPSEELVRLAVSKNEDSIQFIKNPSKEVQNIAVNKDGWCIRFIDSPCEEVQIAAVKNSPSSIAFIDDPVEEACLIAINESWELIKKIKNPSEKVQIAAVKKSPIAIAYIKEQSKKAQVYALTFYQKVKNSLKRGRLYTENIHDPDQEIQILMLQSLSPSEEFIERVTAQNTKMQFKAVKANPYYIRYIKAPDEEVVRYAVSRAPDVFQYIKNPSEELKTIAVERDGNIIQYINNPGFELKKKAVQQNGNAIRHISNPEPEIQELAIQQTWEAVKHIEHIDDNVKTFIEKNSMPASIYLEEKSEGKRNSLESLTDKDWEEMDPHGLRWFFCRQHVRSCYMCDREDCRLRDTDNYLPSMDRW